MIRETVYQAVFAHFSALTAGGAPLFKTATRKAKVWDDVPPEEQPALLMMQRTENVLVRKGLPPLWRLQMDLLLYVHTGAAIDPSVTPSSILNPLLDAVVASIRVDDLSNSACTLGGTVSHCAIEGTIEITEGDLGNEAVAVIPITVLVP